MATFCHKPPLTIEAGIGIKRFDVEGRVLRVEFKKFTLLNIYFPNGTSGPDRVQYKLDFYDAVLDFCEELRQQGRELIVCGDYNTAHQEIDLARPKENVNNSGFLPCEREKVDQWLAAGYIDIFRHFHPEPKHYTWWSYRMSARDRNIGWRIDYFLVTPGLVKFCQDAYLCPDVLGSDHCPAVLILK